MAQVSEVVKSKQRERQSVQSRLQDLKKRVIENKAAYLFVLPFTAIFITFYILPVFASMYLSFTYFNVLEAPRWIGWSNYSLLFLEDDIFLTAIKNTLIFAVIVGPGGFVISWVLAWLINQLKYRVAYTLIFYAPSLTSGLAIGIIFKIFFAGDYYGYLNYVLLRMGVLEEPFQWLRAVQTMLPIVILVSLWMSMGANFLVFLAGLQNIDPELYEAGKVDGIRSRWQEAWYITLPLMKPQLLFGAVMQTVRSLEVSDVAVALTGLPSPLYATHTILTHLLDYAFIRFEMGYAAGISVFLFLLMFSLSRLFMKVFSTRGEY